MRDVLEFSVPVGVVSALFLAGAWAFYYKIKEAHKTGKLTTGSYSRSTHGYNKGSYRSGPSSTTMKDEDPVQFGCEIFILWCFVVVFGVSGLCGLIAAVGAPVLAIVGPIVGLIPDYIAELLLGVIVIIAMGWCAHCNSLNYLPTIL